MIRIIYVAQGCYAKITEFTPDNIQGLVTSGIGTCCHVIVANRATGYTLLCHADGLTNLEDENCGILTWIREACPDGNYKNLIVDIGENSTDSRSGEGVAAFYLEQINRVLEENKIYVSITSHCAQLGKYGIFISRGDCLISDCEHTLLALECCVEIENGQELIQLSDSGEDLLEGRIIKARGYAYSKSREVLKFPAICIFDGLSDELLPIDRIAQTCDEYQIMWDNVMNSDLPSSYAGSESYSSDFESETSEIKEDLVLQIKQREILFNRLLAPEGLRALDVGGGDNCFFHSIAHQLGIAGHNPMAFEELRQLAINYMLNHPQEFSGFTEETLDDYIAKMSQNGEWADNPIIQALVNELNIRIHIYQLDGSIIILEPITNIEIPAGVVSIAYTGAHYLSIESIPSLEAGEHIPEIFKNLTHSG